MSIAYLTESLCCGVWCMDRGGSPRAQDPFTNCRAHNARMLFVPVLRLSGSPILILREVTQGRSLPPVESVPLHDAVVASRGARLCRSDLPPLDAPCAMVTLSFRRPARTRERRSVSARGRSTGCDRVVEAVEIMTGAPVPKARTRPSWLEYVTRKEDGNRSRARGEAG